MPQTRTISRKNTTVKTFDGLTRVRLHQTEIVKFDASTIILNTGGWNTSTTRNRMNQTSNQFGLGFRVSSRAGKLTVTYKGKTYEFFETISFDR